jgi:hypothetical protein
MSRANQQQQPHAREFDIWMGFSLFVNATPAVGGLVGSWDATMAPGIHARLPATWMLARLMTTLWRCLNRDTGQPRQPSDLINGPSFPDKTRKPRDIHRWVYAFCLRSTGLSRPCHACLSREASMDNLPMTGADGAMYLQRVISRLGDGQHDRQSPACIPPPAQLRAHMGSTNAGTETGSANGGAPVPCRWVFSKVSGSHSGA